MHSELKSVHPGFSKYNARNSLSRCSNSTKIVVRWGFAPDPTGGAYNAPPDSLAGFKRPYS